MRSAAVTGSPVRFTSMGAWGSPAGTGVTGFNDLSAADVRTAVGLASANLDTQLAALSTAIDATPTNAELNARTLPSADYATAASIAALNNLSAAQVNAQVLDVLAQFGWAKTSVVDLGDISTARGTEQLLPIWIRLWGALGTDAFNFKVAR